MQAIKSSDLYMTKRTTPHHWVSLFLYLRILKVKAQFASRVTSEGKKSMKHTSVNADRAKKLSGENHGGYMIISQ